MQMTVEITGLVIIAGTLLFYGGANWMLLRETVRRVSALEDFVYPKHKGQHQ